MNSTEKTILTVLSVALAVTVMAFLAGWVNNKLAGLP